MIGTFDESKDSL